MSNRTKNWLPIWLMLIALAFLVLTHTSLGLVLFLSGILVLNIILAMGIDSLDERMDNIVREALKLGLGAELKYDTTAMIQELESILKENPNNLKTRMLHEIANKRLDRIIRLEKELKNDNKTSD